MVRPCKRRCVCACPTATVYKPRGVPACNLQMVRLGLDELEALRLADRLGLYHDEAAARMGVSRPTFGRILGSARAKVAEALLEGKGLIFDGGAVNMTAPPSPLKNEETSS